jgi:hypothetical protein
MTFDELSRIQEIYEKGPFKEQREPECVPGRRVPSQTRDPGRSRTSSEGSRQCSGLAGAAGGRVGQGVRWS